jgi:hypothetical protein
MDVGPVTLIGIGVFGEIAHPWPVDGNALSEVLKGLFHSLDAFIHVQKALDISTSDDQSHGVLLRD